MKKTITTLLFTTAIAMGFAQEQTLSANVFTQPKSQIQVDAREMNHKGTIYMKMAVNESELPKNDEKLMPGLGLGYRAAFGSHAVDVSVDGNRREIRDVAQEKAINYSYTLPKVNYLYYVTPANDSSFYAGAGLALGGMKDTTVVSALDEILAEDGSVATPAVLAHNEIQEFHGIIPNVAAGYEFGRNSNVRTFLQLDVSQPAIAAVREGKFFGPKVAFSVGAGF